MNLGYYIEVEVEDLTHENGGYSYYFGRYGNIYKPTETVGNDKHWLYDHDCIANLNTLEKKIENIHSSFIGRHSNRLIRKMKALNVISYDRDNEISVKNQDLYTMDYMDPAFRMLSSYDEMRAKEEHISEGDTFIWDADFGDGVTAEITLTVGTLEHSSVLYVKLLKDGVVVNEGKCLKTTIFGIIHLGMVGGTVYSVYILRVHDKFSPRLSPVRAQTKLPIM